MAFNNPANNTPEAIKQAKESQYGKEQEPEAPIDLQPPLPKGRPAVTKQDHDPFPPPRQPTVVETVSKKHTVTNANIDRPIFEEEAMPEEG